MAEFVSAVTDTHALLFRAAGSGRLGRKGVAHYEACERREAILNVPSAVIWECALLARAGRVNLRRSVRGFFEDLFSNPAYQPYDQLPLITRDGDIRSSRLLRVMW